MRNVVPNFCGAKKFDKVSKLLDLRSLYTRTRTSNIIERSDSGAFQRRLNLICQSQVTENSMYSGGFDDDENPVKWYTGHTA